VSAAPRPTAAVHTKALPPIERAAAQDQKYQKEQEKLVDKQNQDRQKLQQRRTRSICLPAIKDKGGSQPKHVA
jgi:hypothetical protein